MNVRRAVHATGVSRFVREVHLTVLRAEGRLRRRTSGRRRPSAPLRILAHTPGYPPTVHGGAEVTLRAIVRELHARGHDVMVLVDEEHGHRTLDGVDVIGGDSAQARREAYRWTDVAVAHLTSRHRAIRLAARSGRPFVSYVQIGGTPRHATFGTPALTVFSSQVVRDQFPWVDDALVLHPPIDPADYRTEPGDAITLVNLNALKGAATFFALAQRLPDRPFLGVRSWGEQQIPEVVPPNVDLIGPVDDMRAVYGRTRILLVPSVYESYGRVALEAAASGIATIAHPTPGVREAMGDAAIYVDRDDVDGWVDVLESLDDPRAYVARSHLARARIAGLDPAGELAAFEAALLRSAASGETTPP